MDAQEFKSIFLPYNKALFHLAFSFTRNAVDAEDIVQELYLKLWLKRKSIPENKRNYQYIATILRNIYLDSQRSPKPTITSVDKANDVSDKDTPEGMLIEKDNSIMLRNAISMLSDKEKEVIRMHVEQELKYGEISDITGLTLGNIRVIVTRAKRKLISKLTNQH